MKTYKQILKEALGVKWNRKQFHVHHINHDHNDNRLCNLLLMPRRMHMQYHNYMTIVKRQSEILTSLDLDSAVLGSNAEAVERLIKIKTDMIALRKAQWDVYNMRATIKNFNSAEYLETVVGSIYKTYLLIPD